MDRSWRDKIPDTAFAATIGHAAELEHAACGVLTRDGADRLRCLLRAACGDTPDGHWLVADLLMGVITGNLKTRGVTGRQAVQAHLAPFVTAPPHAAPALAKAFEREMRHVRDFIDASFRADYDTQRTLTDRHGEILLAMLAGMVAATCPKHRR